MKFHPEKCKVLHIGRKHTMVYHDYVLNGKTLASSISVSYLGVTFTQDLRWNEHISYNSSKANSTLGFLRRNLRINSPTLKTLAYNTLVSPTLEYASIVWEPYTKMNIDKLEIVQRKAARFVLNRYHNTSSVSNMLEQLGWKSLPDRRMVLRLYMFYKIQTAWRSWADLFHPMTRPCRHLHCMSYEGPPSRTTYHQMSFFPRTIRDWNKLPDSVVLAPSLVAFKCRPWDHLAISS